MLTSDVASIAFCNRNSLFYLIVFVQLIENALTIKAYLGKTHRCTKGGGFRPLPQVGEKCIGWVEKREKKERKGEKAGKNKKNYAKNRKRGKIEENRQIWLKIGTNG